MHSSMQAAFSDELEKIARERGLWDNIHAKRRRIAAGSGERMRRTGSEGAPTAKAIRDSKEKKAAREERPKFPRREQVGAALGLGMNLAGTGLAAEDLIRDVKGKPSLPRVRYARALHLASLIPLAPALLRATRHGKEKKAEVEYRGRTFPGYNRPIASDRKGKKKMVLVKRGDKVKLVHFGQKGYEDFTQHKDKARRKNYLARSGGIRGKGGKLTKNDPFSPNYWARRELW